MNIRDLEYFQQIVKKRSFVEVAEIFHVSQPTITYAIKRLEAAFKTKLIIRNQSHHSVTVTEAGEILSSHVSRIIKELDLAKTSLAHLKNEVIVCGVPPIVGNYYFPQISIALFENKLMEKIHILNAGSRDLYRLLQAGKIDMAILGSIHSIEEDDFISKFLTEKRFMIVVSPQHPLAKRKSICFSELKDEKFVMLNESYIHSNGINQLAHANHFKPNIVYKSKDLNILKGMIREKIGIGFLAQIALDENDQLVQIPIEDASQPTFQVFLVRKNQGHLSETYKKIVEIICDYPY